MNVSLHRSVPLPGSEARAAAAAGAAAVLCFLLPWLQPFAPGPSTNVVPWLASATCGLLALLLLPARLPGARVLLGAAAVVLFVVLRPAEGVLDRAALAGAVMLVLLAWSVAKAAPAQTAALAAAAWLGAALLSAVIGLLQYFGYGADLPWVHAAQAGEALANLRQRNQFASLTTIGLASLLWYAGSARARWLPWTPAVALLAAANAATASRTGLLQWLLLFVLIAMWRGPAYSRRLLLCAAGLLAYAFAALALPVLLERTTGLPADTLFGRLGADLGCSSRRVLWGNVLTLIGQRPLAGWGWGELDYAHFVHLYGDAPRFCDILDNAHNLPLHVAVELGVPAAVLLCAGVAWATWRSRPWRESDRTRQLAWSVLMVLGLHSLLEYPLWYGPFQLALGLSLGLLMVQQDGRVARASGFAARLAIAACGLALLALLGFDYARVSQVYLEPERRVGRWREDPMTHARGSWLFKGQADFAKLTLTPLTHANAAWMHAQAERMLHFSPEPRVIEKAIESATMVGRYDKALLHLARYRAAFPDDYQRWRASQRHPLELSP